MSTMKIFLLALPLLLGIAFISLARWAQRRNSKLNQNGRRTQYEDFVNELRQKKIKRAFQSYFLGSQDKFTIRMGRCLMVLVIVAVLGVLFYLSGNLLYLHMH